MSQLYSQLSRAMRVGLMARVVILSACALLSTRVAMAAEGPALPAASVGMPAAIEQLVLPGTELEPLPLTDKSPVVIRVDAIYPHGSELRYDLVCYGLEPGEYDLRQFLKRKDGGTTDDLPPLLFKVESLLPPGQIEPHELDFVGLPWLGGYRLLLLVGTAIWVVGLYWLLVPRRKRTGAAQSIGRPAPITLADRLRPLVTEAVAGRLPPERLAELERALVSYWRRRLNLDHVAPAEALARLRENPEARPLLEQLETWLHRPAGAGAVDVGALLEPYRNIAPDELSVEPALAAKGAR